MKLMNICHHKQKIDGNAVGQFLGMATGQKGIFETLDDMGSDTGLGKKARQMMDSDLGQALKRFEELGGMQQLHKGFNEIRDTFYDGNAPKDWQTTNNLMSQDVQVRQEQNIYNFTHNSTNKNVVEVKVRADMEKQYRGKQKPDNFEELISKKVKNDLKEFADTYVKLGIRTAEEAYKCKKLRDDSGLTAEEAAKIVLGSN